MRSLSDELSHTSHHAFCIAGGWDEVARDVSAWLSDRGVVLTANPDVQVSVFPEGFGIDESRALEASAHRVAHGAEKFFVVGASTVTHEAQNSLLKLLEDPPQQTIFFLVVPSHGILLPTLRSRLYLINAEVESGGDRVQQAETFLGLGVAARLEHIAKLLSQDSRRELWNLMDGLEEVVPRTSDAASVVMVRRYADDRGASLKLLLEHMALQLPVNS